MKKLKFMHIADVHLGVIPDKGKTWSEQRSREIYHTFERILEIAGEEKVDLLLIAGDLFHYPPRIAMLKELDAQLAAVPDMTTILIAGNHDYRAAGSPLDRYEFQSDTICLKAGEAERVVLDDLRTCVTGISYDRQEIAEGIYDVLEPEETGETAGYCQILLAHGGDARHCPLDRERLLASDFDYIALGHIHKPEIIAQDRMAFAGSPEPIDYTDTGERGYIIGETIEEADGWKIHTKWVPVCNRQYVDLTVQMEPDMTNFQLLQLVQDRIGEIGTQHIYRIILEGCHDGVFRPDFNSLMNLYHIYEVVDHTHGVYDLERLAEENADNLLGRYIRNFENQEDELHQRALDYGVRALMRCREWSLENK